MTRKEYSRWRSANPLSRHGKFLKGKNDPIIILAIPTGREVDMWLEGFVIFTQTIQYPIGYCSFAWYAENFDFTEGSLIFNEK